MPRYLLAIVLPNKLEIQLKQIYQHTFHQPCPVRTLHCTLIPPFTFKNEFTQIATTSQLEKIPPPSHQFEFGTPNIFIPKLRQILFLPIVPAEPLRELYKEIIEIDASAIHIETNAFSNNLLPEFIPHITLHYNFEGQANQLVMPEIKFNLPSPQILVETGPGIWDPYQA